MPRKPRPSQVTRFLDAWFSLRQFIQAANFNRFQGTGLSATQFMTLNLLPSNSDGLSMGELARRLNLKPATVAKTVDSLEARTLVTRIRHATDKRIVIVTVTDTGMQLQNAAQGQFHAQISQLFHAMAPRERDALILGLESISRVAALTLAPPPSAAEGHAAGRVPQVPRLRPGIAAPTPARTKAQPGPRTAPASPLTPRAGAAPPASRSSRQSRRPKS